MGGLAQTFHVRPWEIDRLTIEEFEALCNALDAKNKE